MTAITMQTAYLIALKARGQNTGEIAAPLPANPIAAAADLEECRQISRAKSGDPGAITWLLSRYRPRILRLAAGMLRGSAEEAEDAAQDAFIRVFRSLRSYREDAPFAAWLYRIAVRVCLDRRKANVLREEVRLSEAVAASLPTGGASPDISLLIDKLFDELTPTLRAALLLREIEGLSYEETAVVLGVPVGTVRSRLSAARSRFRELWQDVQEETENV